MQQTSYTGLSTEEAQKLLALHGPNALPEQRPPSQVEIFLEQLKSPLVYVLIVAAVITRFLGDQEDTIIISIAIFLNTILGYYQESKAGTSLQALKKMLQSNVKVIRDGQKQHIESSNIVPGDVVILQSGEKAPADGKILEANRLFMTEAMLTGESVPIEKSTEDGIYMGTIVQGGNGIMEVQKTGSHTEMGKIAENLGEPDTLTPLQRQLSLFSKQLSLIVLAITGLVFVIGILDKQPIVEIFATAVALAVGAIPEGLLVALTAVLAIGMQRILKRKGLAKHLVSAETLGGVTVICSDKTGTLTQGNMQVVEVHGDQVAIATQAMLANDEDNAVAIATMAWAKQKLDLSEIHTLHHTLDSIPFASENKFIAALTTYTETNNILFINGAPDFLVQRCDLSAEEKSAIQQNIEHYTGLGYRLVGYSRKLVPQEKQHIEVTDAHDQLEWMGFVCISDPVREDVQSALQETKQAGIKLIVITGDFTKTAKHIIQSLGMELQDQHVMLGTTLAAISDDELSSRLDQPAHVKLFARTKPEQKMRIVNALKDDGEVVAMMGDGVNDAPALKKADIGIVVNEATDVAKESADLILLDSSFNTIVAAVEEGRTIFDNIRKIILYLLCDAFVQIIAIIISMIVGLPIPVTAAQILWINLVSDGFPSLALTLDPKRQGNMQRPPRSPKEPLIATWMITLILIVSASGALVTLLLYNYIIQKTQDIELARSVAFASFGLTTLCYVYSVRTLRRPLWSENPLNNYWLIAGVFGGLALIVLPFLIPGLGDFLDLVAIGNRRWAALATGFIIVVIIEIFKWVARNHIFDMSKQHSH